MLLCSHVIMYTIIQPLRGSDAHTSVMYTTVNIHIWSMRLFSNVIMYTIIKPLRGVFSHTYTSVISIYGDF